MSTTADTDEIRRELTSLTQRLEAIESRLAQNGENAPATIDLAGRMAEVLDITQSLFPGRCEFTSESDPEYPDDRYVVMNVEGTGDPRDIVDRSCEWHERIRGLSGELAGKLRLSVVPV